MPMWVFLLIIFGGILLFGVVYDRITKRKITAKDIQTGIKNSSASNMVYKETFLNEQRNDIHDNQGNVNFF
ncbi:hypothetical protein ABHN04_07360, partial [Brevibacillus parabrevis]|uniref:hypothetical protein n=2 Tax=Brevibacillus TaxID=55080 RepID=UPI003D23A949